MTLELCALDVLLFALVALFAHLWWKERTWRKELQWKLSRKLGDLRTKGDKGDGGE